MPKGKIKIGFWVSPEKDLSEVFPKRDEDGFTEKQYSSIDSELGIIGIEITPDLSIEMPFSAVRELMNLIFDYQG